MLRLSESASFNRNFLWAHSTTPCDWQLNRCELPCAGGPAIPSSQLSCAFLASLGLTIYGGRYQPSPMVGPSRRNLLTALSIDMVAYLHRCFTDLTALLPCLLQCHALGRGIASRCSVRERLCA